MTTFTVLRNGIREAEIPATKKAMREYIRDRARIGTHMGGSARVDGGYEYATTVGVYYRFIRGENENFKRAD